MPTRRIPDLIRARMAKDRPMTTLTVTVPADVVESMKRVAERRGIGGHEALSKAYIGDGLRRDEAEFTFGARARFLEALRRRGVSDDLLKAAEQDAA